MEEREEEPHLLDIRSEEAFLALHHRRAACIADGEFADRLHELPPPCNDKSAEPLVQMRLVFDDPDRADSVAQMLEERGYSIVERIAGEKLAERFASDDLVSGKSFFTLWGPNPALAKCWPLVLQHVPERRLCLDLAAGNGRDVVFCARAGFECVGIDYQKRQWSKIDALHERALKELPDDELARYGSVRSDHSDLEKGDVVLKVMEVMRGELATLVIVSRYLHRPLNPLLHKLVAPGGLLLFHTFLEGAELVGRKTPSKPRFLLRRDELREVLEPHFDILEDSVLLLPDQRPTSCFLGRRKRDN